MTVSRPEESRTAVRESVDSAGRDAWRGFVDILPLQLGAIPFALLLGSLAVQKGLSPLEVLIMSATVFAGGAQFLAVEIWSNPTPVIAIVAATFLVNMRHVLMGAALQPHIAHLPPSVRGLFVSIHADESWATAIRTARHRKLTAAYVLGMIVPFYLNWPFWGLVGALFGGLVQDPARYGADFVFTAVFLCLVVGLWRGRASAPPVIVGALSALVAHRYLPGVWYVFVGGLAGTIAGAVFWRPNDIAASGSGELPDAR